MTRMTLSRGKNSGKRSLTASGLICLMCLIPLRAPAQQLDLGTRPAKQSTSGSRALDRYIPPDLPPAFLRKSTDTRSTKPHPTTGQSTRITMPRSPIRSSIPQTPAESAPVLSATVTHTLYLPPAMYGEWNVSGRLIETNAPDLYSPNSNDIWLLEREGNEITVTNPTNGARASISVDRADGNQATFHRSGTAGDHAIYQEIPTITVNGDQFSGKSLNKIQTIKNGQVVDEVYGIYQLEATRINAARTRFRPETDQQEPDLQIDEIRHPPQ